MTFADQVFSRQTIAFKLNLNFGYILRNRKTREVRYFKPFEHEGVLDVPIYISNRRDLQRLKRFLNHLNFLEILLRQRQDTKWVKVTHQRAVLRLQNQISFGKPRQDRSTIHQK